MLTALFGWALMIARSEPKALRDMGPESLDDLCLSTLSLCEGVVDSTSASRESRRPPEMRFMSARRSLSQAAMGIALARRSARLNRPSMTRSARNRTHSNPGMRNGASP